MKLVESDGGVDFIKEILPGGEESWLKMKDFPRYFQPSDEFYKERYLLTIKIKELNIEGADIPEAI